MKRDVHPAIAVIGILIALTVVQLLYWRGLVERETMQMREGGGRRGGPALARGDAGAEVTTIAGRPEAGYRDGPAEQALFDGPAAVAAASDGTLYVADSRNHCIRVISPDGTVYTLAGAAGESGCRDGPAREGTFSAPSGIALAPDGSVLVSDTGNHRIRRITPGGSVVTYAGAETPRDDLGREGGGFRDGRGDQAQFCYPVGLVVDAAGAVYVADAGNGCVRRISADGIVSTIETAGEQEMEAATEIALGPGGRLWVSDTTRGVVWVGPRSGPLRTVEFEEEGAELVKPAGIAVFDGPGSEGERLYIADSAGHCLYVRGEGRLRLLVGHPREGGDWEDGAGSQARFNCPAGLAVLGEDRLCVADFANNCLREVSVADLRGGRSRGD